MCWMDEKVQKSFQNSNLNFLIVNPQIRKMILTTPINDEC